MKVNVDDIMHSYFKTEDDIIFLLKANVIGIADYYSKTKDDSLLFLKADKSELIYSYF